MLPHTFCHLSGIGVKTERRLWDLGLTSWDAVLTGNDLPLASPRMTVLKRRLHESRRHLEQGHAHHFYRGLPVSEHWRLFGDFRHSVAFLDIETTGLGESGDYITTIAVYDGRSVTTFVHGQNLDEFPGFIARFRLLVTFNGKTFDLPFIRRYFRMPVNQAHIDLRYVLRSLGYRGGLKSCEHQLGLDRNELEGVDGFFAVLLWADYKQRHNEAALETLLAYNTLDVLNLETLMTRAYNAKLADTPFAAEAELPPNAPPPNPFTAHLDTVRRIRIRCGG